VLAEPAVVPVQAVFVMVESTVGPERVKICSVIVPPGTIDGLVRGADMEPVPVVSHVTTLPRAEHAQPGVMVEM
jgi:hypothetical protein